MKSSNQILISQKQAGPTYSKKEWTNTRGTTMKNSKNGDTNGYSKTNSWKRDTNNSKENMMKMMTGFQPENLTMKRLN